MKILKHGNGFSWSLKTKCDVKTVDVEYCLEHKVDPCGSELEIDRNDLRIDYENNKYTYLIICPVCKCRINIKNTDIPPYIQEYVNKNVK